MKAMTKNHNRLGRRIMALLLVFSALGINGCGSTQAKEERLREVEFTVLALDELPEEIQLEVEEQREEEFQSTFLTEEYLYVVKGYGVQESDGYDIQINDFYLTEEYMVFDTKLVGPKEGQKVKETPSYPVVAVKTEAMDKNVIFQ